MSTISAKLVQELRERTGAGMMECKKALMAVNGDIEAAIEAMRKSGQAKADKKAGRVTAEGLIAVRISSDAKHGVILEVNCETDFVARDASFKQFVEQAADSAVSSHVDTLDSLMTKTVSSGQTVEQERQQLIAKIGENIQIRRFASLSTTGTIGSYVHGGRIGVLVELSGGSSDLAKDIAMHIAASNPLVVKAEDVPAELVAKEKEIFTAQAQESGKPMEIIEKMIGGRIKKFLDEVSLLGQPFVKDPSVTVESLLKSNNASISKFIRFEVGEGIEKKTEDFAAEVMAQVRGS